MKMYFTRIIFTRTILIVIATGLFASCKGAESESLEKKMNAETKRVARKTYGDGRWFPASGKTLKEMIRGYMDAAEVPEIKGRIVGIIAPHAGYVYSGRVAGCSFRAVEEMAGKGDAPETVVVIGFSHSRAFNGVALMDGDAIQSPLGETDLDVEAGEFLVKKSGRIFFEYAPHAGEHSAENEIPFVQTALPKSKLVVAIMGDHDTVTIDEFAAALQSLAERKKILLVASSDMLHDPDYDLVTKTDKATLEKVEKMDIEAVRSGWSGRKQTFCGVCPVLTVMKFSKGMGCERGTLLHYRNSGDDFPEGRGNWVVGYGAVVFAVENRN